MPRSPREKRVRATIMDDRACCEYPRRDAIRISVTPARSVCVPPGNPGGQTAHYADDALSDERKSRRSHLRLTPLLPAVAACVVAPFLREKKREKKRRTNARNCQVHTSRVVSVIAARDDGLLLACAFSSEMQIQGNCRSPLASVHRHERANPARFGSREEPRFYIYLRIHRYCCCRSAFNFRIRSILHPVKPADHHTAAVSEK